MQAIQILGCIGHKKDVYGRIHCLTLNFEKTEKDCLKNYEIKEDLGPA